MDTSIGKRLKEFRERTKTKMPAIAEVTGISKENLYKWEKGTRPSDIEDYNALKAYLDKMENMMVEEPAADYERGGARLEVSIALEGDEKPETYMEGKAIPGTVTQANNKLALIAWRNDSIYNGEVDGLINVPEESMEPEFKRGSLIAIRKLKYPEAYNPGYYYYVIDKNLHGMLRRLYQDNDGDFVLHAENEKYPPIKKTAEDIVAIFKVEEVRTKR